MATLLVGFDSAWTAHNTGSLASVLRGDDGSYKELECPKRVHYHEAEECIQSWQSQEAPSATMVLLDQPTIVSNALGQRPVENLVGSTVSRRYGGMQPANTAKRTMFGPSAPVWNFLRRFGGPANPLEPMLHTSVIETYPVLAIIALGWTLPDTRPAGRLPKYNPQRRKTFSLSDWQHLCSLAASAFKERGLSHIPTWLERASQSNAPKKQDQDGLDACICLLTALFLAERQDCLMVGDQKTGYIVAPYQKDLFEELKTRCEKTGRKASEWVHSFLCQ